MADVTTDFDRWTNPDSFLRHWDGRAEFMAQFVAAGSTVLDIGCGAMALEKSLPVGCTYIPCDLAARDERTIVCNLNAGEFPQSAAMSADLITFLGVVEYLTDPQSLFATLRKTGKPVAFTYHPTELTGHLDRPSLGWINHFAHQEVINIIIGSGFKITNIEQVNEIQVMYKLSPLLVDTPPTKRVAVLSYMNLGNFGDRLGYHMLNSVLPPTADVTQVFFDPWTDIDIKTFDLLVVGIGNSLFSPIITSQLERLVAEAPRTIGIFGTQYRGAIPSQAMRDVMKHIDTWYARYEEDVRLYGDMARNTVHLGDWLIDAFPMANAELDETLTIGDEVWGNQPLDRTIQHIQRYKTVHSPRIHPLLCALTSAKTMAYTEQRGLDGVEASGKFRSMLFDIFGRTYPENTLCGFDREKVRTYKNEVNLAVQGLREDLHQVLA